MISEKETVQVSKFMSLVLRHQPETIGLELDEQGWADATSLVEKMQAAGVNINREILDHIVSVNPKQRFSFNTNKTKIRANQGHSVAIDLAIKQVQPPEILYHGTGAKSVESILVTGLEKRSRQHVHLSNDKQTAHTVGTRHGKPEIFEVAARRMYTDGFLFYLSENNVWLTDSVPALYLKLID